MSDQKTQLAGRKRRRVEVQGYDKEVIIQIIKTMMKSASGIDTHLFSYGPFDDDGNRSFNCHLCWVTNLHGLNDVRAHLKSDRHCKNLKRMPGITHFKLPLAVAFRHDEASDKKFFKVFAGENIEKPDPQLDQCYLPEFQWFLTEVNENIAKILSEDPMNDSSRKQTLLGVNFLGKMASATGEIGYYCFLCEAKLKIEENEDHFRSVDHELKYIKEFFPMSYKKAIDSFNFLEEAKINAAVCHFFRNIYAELEAKYGFQNISVVSEIDLNNNFTRLQSHIWSLDHYGEAYSDYSEKRVAAYVHKLLEVPKSYKEIKPPADFIADTSFLTEQSAVADRQPPPKKRAHSDDIKSFIDRYELQKFKDKEVEVIKARFKTFENDPKSYRTYSEEWNKFYQSRRAELEKEGTNLTSYNFQKDFKDWWKTRCEELMNIAIKEKLAEIDSGACRPPKKPENTNPPIPVVKPTINNPVRTVTGVNKPIPAKQVAPPPPIWKGRGQEVVNTPAPSPIAVPPIMMPISNIPHLLLGIETFMASLGPGILQLINQANSFKQGNDPTKIGTYAVLCRQIEAALAAQLADVNKLRIFKNAVTNLNAIVYTGSPYEPAGTPYGPPGIPYGSNGAPILPPGMSYGPTGMPHGLPGIPYGPTPPYGPNGNQYGPSGAEYGQSAAQYAPNQTPFRPTESAPAVEMSGNFARSDIQQSNRNSMNINTNGSPIPDKKPAITSLRQTTNPIFDFEKKTYGKVEVKDEDNADDDIMSISSTSQYESERHSSRDLSPISNHSFKSDYGERRATIQPTRKYMDRDGTIRSLEDRRNGRNTPSFGNQNRYFGNSSNSSQNMNRNESYRVSSSNRRHY